MTIKDKILVIEDEQNISNFISAILTANGYDVLVARNGTISLHGRPVIISTVFEGQRLGLREVDTDVWLVSFMHYDLGYIDLEARTLQTIDTPFGSRVSPM